MYLDVQPMAVTNRMDIIEFCIFCKNDAVTNRMDIIEFCIFCNNDAG